MGAPWPDDPYPRIACALLHSGDLRAYAEHGATSDQLFQPFDPSKLKPASYEISACGTAYWWSEAAGEEPHTKELSENDTLVIPENGIVFIRPRVKFNVPPYLALRFNLHIRLVHRGLLLGTGPLVDPGFEGHLLIPVHNLTDRPFVLRAADGFIWIEVTKLSPLSSNPSGYAQFPRDKVDVDPKKYFYRASGGTPIRSSIPHVAEDVKKTRDELKTVEQRAFWTSSIALVGVIVGVIGLLVGTWSIWRDTYAFVSDARTQIRPTVSDEVRQNTDDLRGRVKALEDEVAALRRDKRPSK